MLSGAQCPATAARKGTGGTIAAAGLCSRCGCCGTVAVKDVRFGKRKRVGTWSPSPDAEDEMQIFGDRGASLLRRKFLEEGIDEIIAFCEAEDLAMRVPAGGHDHIAEIIPVEDVTRDMETEKPGEHDDGFDFTPIGVRVDEQDVEVMLVSAGDCGAEALELSCVAFFDAGAGGTGFSGGE